jgi:DNA-binding IclR family transcriptional regulator
MKKPLRLLGNARRLMDAIAEEGPLTTAQLAEALEMPRSTVFRLAEGLAAVDFVTIRPNGAVDLASRWLYLADVACDARAEWRVARRILHELAETTECTSVLSVYQDGVPLCLDWVPGKANEVLQAKPGRSLPLHAGAEGRAILSGLSDRDLDEELARAPFQAFTPSTMVSADELRGDVSRSRRQGYTVSLEDVLQGIGSIGVLVKDPERGQLGSISVANVSDEILRRSDELGQMLVRAARELADQPAQIPAE